MLTANTITAYGTNFLYLQDGPIVVEAPPNSLCFVDDLWQRYVTDMGLAGPDGGQGGTYLILPPGTTARSPTATSSLAPRPTPTGWSSERSTASRAC